MDVRVDCPSKYEKSYSNQGSPQNRYSIEVSHRFFLTLAPEQFVGKTYLRAVATLAGSRRACSWLSHDYALSERSSGARLDPTKLL